MKYYNEDLFILKTDDGKELEFYKLLTFKNNKSNDKYLVYMNSNEEYFCSIIKNIKDEIILEKIDQNDINEINNLLNNKLNISTTKSIEGNII